MYARLTPNNLRGIADWLDKSDAELLKRIKNLPKDMQIVLTGSNPTGMQDDLREWATLMENLHGR